MNLAHCQNQLERHQHFLYIYIFCKTYFIDNLMNSVVTAAIEMEQINMEKGNNQVICNGCIYMFQKNFINNIRSFKYKKQKSHRKAKIKVIFRKSKTSSSNFKMFAHFSEHLTKNFFYAQKT